MDDETKTLQILLKFGLDDAKAKAAAAALKDIDKNSQHAAKSIAAMRENAEKMAQVGSRLAMAGAAITAPFLMAAQKYVQVGGKLESTSARWINSMKRIEDAETRIGRVATNAINPALERAADLADQIAAAFERNPAAMQSILGTGAGVTAVGGVMMGGAQLAGTIATLKQLSSQGGAAGNIAFSTPYLAAIVAGVMASGVVVSAVNEMLKKVGASQAIDDAQARIRATGRYYPGVVRSPEQIAAAGGAGTIGTVLPTNQADRLGAYAAWQQAVDAREAYEKQSEKARTDIVNEQGQQRTDMERDYEQERTRTLADFARQESDMEADYYAQRTEAAANYSIEVQRAEQDHQRAMLQMQMDHNDRVRGLVDERDALGLVREQRDYERQRSSGEKSYNTEAARRSQDFARQIAQMDANFGAQRERRSRDFEIRLAEMDAQHIQEMAKLDEQSKKRLDQFDEQNKKELEQLRKNETERSKILNMVASTQMSIAEAELTVFQNKTVAAYNAWLTKMGMNQTANPNYYVYGTGTGSGSNSGSGGTSTSSSGGGWGGGTNIQQNADGGYPYGRYTSINERGQEFILSNSTTRAMERMVGGRLTQQNILASGGKTLTLNINTGGVSERRVLAMLDDSAEGIMREIRGAFGAA